jgi:transcriptional regulator with XRE-family HTH domain
MNHGKQLRLKLQELGFKKKKLAELMGVHANTITQWLAKDIISATTRGRIARTLGMSEEDIFTSKAYSLPTSKPQLFREPIVGYNNPVSKGPLKKLDAFQYCGLLNKTEDGLKIQRKWRSEW